MHKAVKFNIGKTQELAVLQCLQSCHVGRKVEEPFVTGAHTDQWVEGNREADFNSMKGFPKSTHMYRGRQGGNVLVLFNPGIGWREENQLYRNFVAVRWSSCGFVVIIQETPRGKLNLNLS